MADHAIFQYLQLSSRGSGDWKGSCESIYHFWKGRGVWSIHLRRQGWRWGLCNELWRHLDNDGRLLFYVFNHQGKLIVIEIYGEENSKRFHFICFFTWGGDMSPFWLSMSVGESWGTALKGESWLVGWSGDRASLLSSSRDELSPPAPFGESVTKRKTFSLQTMWNKSTFPQSRCWTTLRTWCTG